MKASASSQALPGLAGAPVPHSSRRVAYLSMSEELRRKYDAHHDVYTVEPMRKRGWIVDPFVDWRAFRLLDWSQYAAVVVRTTWDYQENLAEFLECLDFLESLHARMGVRLLNDAATMRWNIDKRYLVDLARDGVPVVPSVWSGERHASASERLSFVEVLKCARESFPNCRTFVVKPTVSACAWNTFRLRVLGCAERSSKNMRNDDERDSAVPAVQVRRDAVLGVVSSVASSRDDDEDCWMGLEESIRTLQTVFDAVDALSPHFLVQPFLSSVWDGEVSVFLCRGAVTHALRKVPLRSDFRSQEEFGGSLTAWRVDECPKDVLEATSVLVQRCPRVASLLYARVDFLYEDDECRNASCDDAPPRRLLLSELELIEPSLYFQLVPEAAEMFAEAFSDLMCV